MLVSSSRHVSFPTTFFQKIVCDVSDIFGGGCVVEPDSTPCAKKF